MVIVLKPELLRLTEKHTIYIDLLHGYLAIRLRPDSYLSVLLKLGYLLSAVCNSSCHNECFNRTCGPPLRRISAVWVVGCYMLLELTSTQQVNYWFN